MSSFVVSARKYRPTRFSDVVGQSHVTDTLKRALISGKVAHSFLFCGPRGVGKTTCARILAKALNCLEPSEDKEPCNECKSCKAFNDNASFNIIELDAASHNSVENIRNLIDHVGIPPQVGDYKVFIVDEVHMLSTAAFNAFLKTLEEPPSYAIFIFATTEKQKVLATIQSRCQSYDFRRIEVTDIIAHLSHIAHEEGITIEDEALFVMARKADGALRDALSLYDRLSNQLDGNITYQGVIDSLGMVDVDNYFQLTSFILSENPGGLLMSVDQLLKHGYEIDVIVEGLTDHIRRLLYFQYPDLKPVIALPESLVERYVQQTSLCGESLLINALDMLTDALFKGQTAPQSQALYDITLTKLCMLNRLLDTSTGRQDVKKKRISELSATSTTASLPQPTHQHAKEKPNNSKNKTLRSKPTKKPAVGTSLMLSSLQELGHQIDEEKKSAADLPEKTNDALLQLWSAYLSEVDSPYITQITQDTSLYWKNDKIVIEVNQNRVREVITKEFNLIKYLRNAYGEPELKISVDVLEGTDIKASRRLITNKEKFSYLVDENPVIIELTQKFQLSFD